MRNEIPKYIKGNFKKEITMKRKIVKIDEEKCTGCGLCIPNCHEGALQIIDNKARLISDLFCDGLGACLGHCPEGAITIEEREAEPYNERKVMEIMLKQGENTIIAHLEHLEEHGETGFLKEALEFLKEKKININYKSKMDKQDNNHDHGHHGHHGHSCPGGMMKDFRNDAGSDNSQGDTSSQLKQWPVQMHLIHPNAPYFRNADVLLAADCVAFAAGNFHNAFLKGKSLAIACPKLDQNTDAYVEKLRMMIDEAMINTLTVAIMEVPCCGGLVQMAKMAMEKASRKVPVKVIIFNLQGKVISENWI